MLGFTRVALINVIQMLYHIRCRVYVQSRHDPHILSHKVITSPSIVFDRNFHEATLAYQNRTHIRPTPPRDSPTINQTSNSQAMYIHHLAEASERKKEMRRSMDHHLPLATLCIGWSLRFMYWWSLRIQLSHLESHWSHSRLKLQAPKH